MRGRSAILAGLLSALLSAPAWGCSLDEAASEPPENICRSDADCGDEGSCDRERGMCVADESGQALDLALQFLPPPQLDAPAAVRFQQIDEAMTHLPPVELGGISTKGAVFDERAGARAPVVARITFTPRQSAGTDWLPPYDVSVTSSERWLDEGHNFEVRLLAETTYDVLIQPLNEARASLPPFRGQLTTGQGDGALSFGYSEVFTVLGVVRDEAGTLQPGVQVQAVDERGALLSSTAEADSQGAFQLALPASVAAGPYGFRFQVSHPERPTFELEARPLLDRDEPVDEPIELLIPTLPPSVTYRAPVKGPGAGGEEGLQPLAGVEATFAASFDDLPGGVVARVARTVVSDAAGRLEVSLPAGEYRVVLRPPSGPGARAGTTLHTLVVPAPAAGEAPVQEGPALRLEPAVVYQAGVFDSQLIPIGEIPVHAEALGIDAARLDRPAAEPGAGSGTTAQDVTALNRSADAVSDPEPPEQGAFLLYLDRGFYDLSAQPDEGSGYPWAVHPNLPVLPPSTSFVDLQLLPPLVLEGEVRLPDGAPAVGATVQALRATADLARGGTRAVLVGRATVGEDGRYRLLVAPRFNPD